MPRAATKAPVAPVTTRRLAPKPYKSKIHIIRPVSQIEGAPEMRVSWPKVTPEQAREWVMMADQHSTEFRQRTVPMRDRQRWLGLMETKRFVEYFPGGPLCFDPEGLLINGKHRLTALANFTEPLGFCVIKNVPRWMYPFFDTGRPRTITDVFHISERMSFPQLGSTTRLGMRYEEFLRGERGELNWREWGKVRDEHADVDGFIALRTNLADFYQVADKTYRGSKLVVAALMVFRYYQTLAWPDGEAKVVDFFHALRTGAMVPLGSPALELRDWAKDMYDSRERMFAKRETHLMLLFRMFALYVQGDTLERGMRWAYGFPMTQPYHPDGHEIAVKNILTTIDALYE